MYAALVGEDLTDFKALADRGRLSPLLKNASIPATVFVPSNEAVAQALSDMGMDAQAIASNASVIMDIVYFGIIPGRVISDADLQRMGASGGQDDLLTTMRGKDLRASTDPSTGAVVVVGGTEARLVPGRTNIRAGSSVLHVVDYLLLPEDTRDEAGLKARAASRRFRTVAEALTQTPQLSSTARAAASDPQLAAALSNPQLVSTVFAPNNAAWAALAKAGSPLLASPALVRESVAAGVVTSRAMSQDELAALGPGSTLSTLSGGSVVVGRMSSAAGQALAAGDGRPVAQEAGRLMEGQGASGGGATAALMVSSDGGAPGVSVVGQPLIAGRSIVHEVDGVLVPKAAAAAVAAVEAEKKKAADAKAAAAALAAAAAAANATTAKANGAAGALTALGAAMAAPVAFALMF